MIQPGRHTNINTGKHTQTSINTLSRHTQNTDIDQPGRHTNINTGRHTHQQALIHYTDIHRIQTLISQADTKINTYGRHTHIHTHTQPLIHYTDIHRTQTLIQPGRHKD